MSVRTERRQAARFNRQMYRIDHEHVEIAGGAVIGLPLSERVDRRYSTIVSGRNSTDRLDVIRTTVTGPIRNGKAELTVPRRPSEVAVAVNRVINKLYASKLTPA